MLNIRQCIQFLASAPKLNTGECNQVGSGVQWSWCYSAVQWRVANWREKRFFHSVHLSCWVYLSSPESGPVYLRVPQCTRGCTSVHQWVLKCTWKYLGAPEITPLSLKLPQCTSAGYTSLILSWMYLTASELDVPQCTSVHRSAPHFTWAG